MDLHSCYKMYYESGGWARIYRLYNTPNLIRNCYNCILFKLVTESASLKKVN